jgi:ABC-2 type transport system ATP-binding protein
VTIAIDHAADIVGAPQLTLRYSGTSPPGERPTRVFAQLVDDATGIVVGTQITPIMVTLDGQEHTTNVPLEIIAFAAKPGSHLTLQLVATTVAYAEPRLGGTIDFRSVRIELPTVTGATG